MDRFRHIAPGIVRIAVILVRDLLCSLVHIPKITISDKVWVTFSLCPAGKEDPNITKKRGQERRYGYLLHEANFILHGPSGLIAPLANSDGKFASKTLGVFTRKTIQFQPSRASTTFE